MCGASTVMAGRQLHYLQQSLWAPEHDAQPVIAPSVVSVGLLGTNHCVVEGAITRGKPPAMLASKSRKNQTGRLRVNKNPDTGSGGSPEASHKARRRPSLRTKPDANGVMMKMPSQVVAANRPATVLETPACLSINSSRGESMKMPTSWNRVEPKTASSPRFDGRATA